MDTASVDSRLKLKKKTKKQTNQTNKKQNKITTKNQDIDNLTMMVRLSGPPLPWIIAPTGKPTNKDADDGPA